MNPTELDRAHSDPELSAKLAGLVYVHNTEPGWSRAKAGKSFVYKDEKGKIIKDPKKLTRIDSYKIPPAWKDVWISPKIKGHLQVTGIDKKGLKQYLYHPRWNEYRDILKFYRLSAFAGVLPVLRREIKKHLEEPEPTRTKVISAALDLVDILAIRIGNDGYAKENKTYGVTTLQNKHIEIHGETIELSFIGKSHKEQSFELKDKKLAKVLKEEMEIPGSRLFQYLDEEHHKHPLTSSEVNAFIKEVTGEEFSAKDFRTWSATAEAYKLMKEECACLTDETRNTKAYDKALKKIIKCVAEKLGNTVAVCKASYVHTDLQKAFLDGQLEATVKKVKNAKPQAGLKTYEVELASVLTLLYKERVKAMRA